ncbi:CHAT domain-containing protein [Winogradskyella ursingii]|uniref:CHAT domain-containing protein n=1 Tax=Winogradskyella ursingii TaxID=2686079 RepID=UPI0015CC907E|nr:CHAT domain-containing tetratricopeptide repeat protein [Winogradskyella ursingii]
MRRFYNFKKVILFLFIISYQFSVCQKNNEYSIKNIENLIDADSLEKAEIELKLQEKFYLNNKQYDSLSNLTYFFGRIAKLKGDSDFIKKSESALERLRKITQNPEALYNAYSDMATLTVENQLYQESYNYNKLGLEVAKKTTEDRLNKMAKRTYGLASTSYFMRKFDLVKKHGIETFNINERNPKATATNIYNAGNIVGLMMQNENKLDSALYYFDKGVKALGKSGVTLSERYYYPAVLNGNIAIIYMNQGKFQKSLKNQQDAIQKYKVFIDSSSNHPGIDNIRYNYLATINDMGSNYVKLGQIERAIQLFEFNYNKAQEYFPKNSIQQVIFTNQLAQGKWVAHDNEEALKLIDESNEKFQNLSSNYAGYMTYGIGTKANILENFGRTEEAYKAYKTCDSLYNIVSPGKYNFDRLTKLREAAAFYSRNNFAPEANNAANRLLDVVKATETGEKLETIKAYNLLAEIKLNLKEYDESINWANKSLDAIERNRATTNMDSIFWHELKIAANFNKSRANYNLIDTTDVEAVSSIFKALKKSIDELNNNASKYTSDIDRNDYIFKTSSLLDFSMQIALQLYSLTNKKEYLDHLISMHESRIYNRIRSKIGVRENIQFYKLPESILKREKQLKDSLALLRLETDFKTNTTQYFTSKNKEWVDFLEDLKLNYPKYYKLRYETLKQSLGNIQSNVPEDTTIIRYFFIGEELYVFLLDSNSSSLHKLDGADLGITINSLTDNLLKEEKNSKSLFKLYNQIWKPFENKIVTNKVVIIPDHELFNLSFETLTVRQTNSLKDLANSMLLSKYIISYNYSLYLLDKDKKTIHYDNDFIAFAPEFNNEMKENYSVAITDSLSVDRTYMQLLPQPFAANLAKEYTKLFNGTSFLNENASKKIFTERAKEHKIIHIGTHAESNNVSPELSRLIFAKNISDDDNSLYTYEIYNENLSSNLAILTACETGKPTYKPGEGMISLAHAFNYAGSESILTSLWKIDEQTSAKIIEMFYNHLKKGLRKDEALQKAKLEYLSSAEGRTLSPQYWAGLVLIGDTSPIQFTQSSPIWPWILGVLFLLAIIYIVVKRFKNHAITK